MSGVEEFFLEICFGKKYKGDVKLSKNEFGIERKSVKKSPEKGRGEGQRVSQT